MAPEIDGGGLGFPDAGGVYARQVHQRAVFAAEGHILIGFRHDGGFAGNRVADHAKAFPGADDKGEEPVEIGQRCLQRLTEGRAVLHFPGQIGGTHFSVILAFDPHTLAPQLAPQAVVVGQLLE